MRLSDIGEPLQLGVRKWDVAGCMDSCSRAIECQQVVYSKNIEACYAFTEKTDNKFEGDYNHENYVSAHCADAKPIETEPQGFMQGKPLQQVGAHRGGFK